MMKNNPYCTEENNCDKTCPYCKMLNEKSFNPDNVYLIDEAGIFPKTEVFDY